MLDRKLMVQVAKLYYEQGLTQQEIGKIIGVSRVTVSAILKESRKRGIVNIQIIEKEPSSESEMEVKLKERFGLKQAVVVQCPPGPDELIVKGVAMAGARLLEEILREGDTLGCSWGRTLLQVAEMLHPQDKHVNVVQLNGGLGCISNDASPSELARHIAQTFGGSYYYLHAPGIVENASIRNALLTDRSIRGTLERIRSVRVAACGIGSFVNSSLAQFGYLPTDFMESLRAKGIVGDICLRFFDIEGQIHDVLGDRVIGITPADLEAVEIVIGIAGGTSKVEAIAGALRTGLLDICVTDTQTAQSVLSLGEG